MKYSNKPFLMALALIVCGSASAETAYVSSRQVKVYQKADFNSALVIKLKVNDEITILDRRGIWLQVRRNGVSGWLSQYSVSTKKPFSKKVSILNRLKNFFIGNNQRDRLTLVSTAGGIRGLTEEESDALGKTDFAAVRQMEVLQISAREVDRFIAEPGE